MYGNIEWRHCREFDETWLNAHGQTYIHYVAPLVLSLMFHIMVSGFHVMLSGFRNMLGSQWKFFNAFRNVAYCNFCPTIIA